MDSEKRYFYNGRFYSEEEFKQICEAQNSSKENETPFENTNSEENISCEGTVPQGTYTQTTKAQNFWRKMPSWIKGLLIILLVVALIVALITGCQNKFENMISDFVPNNTHEIVVSASGDYIGVVYVSDTIDEDGTGVYNHKYILSAIETMKKDNNNKAMLLDVSTPGGSVFASDELYLKIKEYKEKTKRPVYVIMESQATSGGYYISACADKIFANRNCWTGSIGVTLGTIMDVSGLLNNLGIKTVTITSGNNKAMGSNYDEMTPEQRAIFQSLVDESYEQFVEIVAEGRNMSVSQVKKLADGRIYTAKQALDLKLIDQIGTFDDAVNGLVNDYNLGNVSLERFFTSDDAINLGSIFGKAIDLVNQLSAVNSVNPKCKLCYMCNIEK